MKTSVNTNNIESKNLVLTINVGDCVKVKSQDTPAVVTDISEDGKYYTVKFASPVRSFWTDEMMTTAVYSRYGITRNYDRIKGDIIECNAMYYAEELKFGPGSIIEYEFNGVALRVESTREDVEPDNREGWGDKWRVIHHKTGQTIDTMTLSEVAELLAQLYSKSHAPETKHTNNKNLTFQIGDRVERIGTGIARERQERPGTVNTSWATDFTPEDFQKLTSRYEIADEDRDIMGRRFHTGEGLWTVDVFVSDYAGNEAHALIYLLTGEGEVRANVLSLDHLRQTLTEAKGWTRTA